MRRSGFKVQISVLSFLLSLLTAGRAQAQSCDQARNPHSFGCADLTFTGNIFPMIDMTANRVRGPWKLLTYADRSGVQGPEFGLLLNPENPRIPEGVVNRRDGSRAGSLEWNPGRITMLNWGVANFALVESPRRTKFPDRFTSQIILGNGRHQHAFQCRLFERRGADHLLCRWQSLSAAGNRFIFRGYMGFLRGR